MLRVVIWLLVLANAGYFAWTQGYLGALGLKPVVQSEPERLQSQIKPEGLRLLNAPRPASAPAPAAAPATPATPATPAAPPEATVVAVADTTEVPVVAEPPASACWLTSGFSSEQADVLRSALQQLDLPGDSWQLNEVRSGGRWVVYMGRYNDEQMARKKTELRDIKIEFREGHVSPPRSPVPATPTPARAAPPGFVPQLFGLRADRRADAVPVGREGFQWLPGR